MLSAQGVDVGTFTFDFEAFADAISDSVICDRIVIPPCKVAGVNPDMPIYFQGIKSLSETPFHSPAFMPRRIRRA